MDSIDFEKRTFDLFATQLKAMYNITLTETERIELLGMVSMEEFGKFDFHHSFMDEAAACFTANSNTSYSGNDIQLWKLNNFLILVRETADEDPQIFGIYAKDEE